jgi:hypothetical protein
MTAETRTRPRRFRCFVLQIGGRVWHWHWPRSGILACPRSALAAQDKRQQLREGD